MDLLRIFHNYLILIILKEFNSSRIEDIKLGVLWEIGESKRRNCFPRLKLSKVH